MYVWFYQNNRNSSIRYSQQKTTKIKNFTVQLDHTTSEVKACWIRGLDFNAQKIKVLDHFHYSGEFRIWATIIATLSVEV